MRTCGDCQLCCKLLPMKPSDAARPAAQAMIDHGLATAESFIGMRDDFHKAANVRCPHQHHRKGCAIYAHRPFGCRTWSCRWLVNDDTTGLRRPDRAHYVIDMIPDYVIYVDHATGNRTPIQVIQVWLDPSFPHAHRDPALRAYLERRAAQGTAALIRLSDRKAFSLFAPAMSDDGQWHEKHPLPGQECDEEHTMQDRADALGAMRVTWR